MERKVRIGWLSIVSFLKEQFRLIEFLMVKFFERKALLDQMRVSIEKLFFGGNEKIEAVEMVQVVYETIGKRSGRF